MNPTGSSAQYIHLLAAAEMPGVPAAGPYKAVVIAEEDVGPGQREVICRWLADTGCLYMMAWGTDCGDWATAMGLANHTRLAGNEKLSSEKLIISTAHDQDALRDVFWFAKHTAMHPCHALDNTIILHMATTAREEEMIAAFTGA